MIAVVRAFAKTWFAAALLGLLIFAFAVFGIGDVFKGRVSDWVVQAGARTLSAADFKRDFDQYKKRAETQYKTTISVDDAVGQGLDKQVLRELVLNESIAERLRRMGVLPTDKLVGEAVRQQPDLFNKLNGKFDENAYVQRLQENGLTPATFESLLRDDIASEQFMSGLANGLGVPRVYSALPAAYALELRDITYFVIPPKAVPAAAPPTDADLQAFMKANAQALTRPEMRVLSVVRFSPKPLEAGIVVPAADVQKQFEAEKPSLAKPERRSLVQISAADAASAAQIAARLTKGEDPAAVAKAFGKQPLTLTDKPQSEIPDRKVGAAAFALKEGQVSGPIQGDLGLSVVKVEKITPAVVPNFDAEKARIEAKLKTDKAAEQVSDQAEKYDTAHTAGANLSEAAAKAGAVVQTLAPVSAQGLDEHGQPNQALSADILKAAFALPAGGESELEDLGGGEYYAVRVEKIVPPTLPQLAEIKPQLTQAYIAVRLRDAIAAKANDLVARVTKGESMDAAAASVGAKTFTSKELQRANAQQQVQVFGQDLLGKLFGAKAGEAFAAQAPAAGYLVIKVDSVRPAPMQLLAQYTEGQRGQMTYTIFQGLGDAARADAARELKTKSDLTRARTAIGLDADTIAKLNADAKVVPAKAGAKGLAK